MVSSPIGERWEPQFNYKSSSRYNLEIVKSVKAKYVITRLKAKRNNE